MKIWFLIAVVVAMGVVAVNCATINVEDQETESQVEGKGYISSIWDWITAPFVSWYTDEEEEIVSQKPQDIAPTLIVVPSTIETEKEKEPEVTNESRADNSEQEQKIAKSNCNEHTCTTTFCSPDGTCTDKTCNIYDTNMKGECQEYAHLQMTVTTSVPTDEVTEKNKKEDNDDDDDVVKQSLDSSSVSVPKLEANDQNHQNPSLYSILGSYYDDLLQNTLARVHYDCDNSKCVYVSCTHGGFCSTHICNFEKSKGYLQCIIQPEITPISNPIPQNPAIDKGANLVESHHSSQSYSISENHGSKQESTNGIIETRFTGEGTSSSNSESKDVVCNGDYCMHKTCTNGKCETKKCDLQNKNCHIETDELSTL